ncbi:hypothetical protein [Plebeiibacterium sediminum]|uniref:Uncharacterized protein n=1 Tax=Plebeiibacterium sediminum TaxID=2992112 RepID=A0AAE3M6E6_9BACT|nr:hypothetical protein [Plebeiobacterium sediminum]MCW3787629.1 hypothetical protein [Plebeiobacterium sediminum]
MKRLISFWGLLALIISVTFNSCDKADDNDKVDICDVSNPAEDIPWLKNAIDDVKEDEYAYYVKAVYNGATVFYYGNCNPVVDYISIVQNCDGDNLGFTNEFYDDLTDISVIWKHENSKCDFQE